MKFVSASTLEFLLLLVSASFISQVVDAGRDRMDAYVIDQQQFFVIDPSLDGSVELRADPDAQATIQSKTFWFCPPEHGADSNRDGRYDNYVSHVVQYCSRTNTWRAMGYTAVWSGYQFDETLVDYDLGSTVKIFPQDAYEGKAPFAMYQLPTASNKMQGKSASGTGKWVRDVSDPLLSNLDRALQSQNLGLHSGHCREMYSRIYNDKVIHDNEYGVEFEEGVSGGSTRSLKSFAVVSTFLFALSSIVLSAA